MIDKLAALLIDRLPTLFDRRSRVLASFHWLHSFATLTSREPCLGWFKVTRKSFCCLSDDYQIRPLHILSFKRLKVSSPISRRNKAD